MGHVVGGDRIVEALRCLVKDPNFIWKVLVQCVCRYICVCMRTCVYVEVCVDDSSNEEGELMRRYFQDSI